MRRLRDGAKASQHDGARNIVKLIKSKISGQTQLDVEYCSRGDLFHLIPEGGLSETQARPWFKQLCNGVDFIHKQGVVHLDLSTENVFITEDGTVKIGDFGHARMLKKGEVTIQGVTGKRTYRAPEVHVGEFSILPTFIPHSPHFASIMLCTVQEAVPMIHSELMSSVWVSSCGTC